MASCYAYCGTQSEVSHPGATGAGNLTLVWDSNRVEVTSDFLELVMFVTPGGTVDRGQAQPAYMNFDAALLKHTTEALEVRENGRVQHWQCCRLTCTEKRVSHLGALV